MIELYPPFAQQLAHAQARHKERLPMIAWVGDGDTPADPEARVIAANLAHILGGVLVVDRHAA